MSTSNLSILPTPALYVLSALAEGNCHGYAIMQRVTDRSNGAVPLRTGSLYRHLSKLIRDGLIQEAPVRGADRDVRRGTDYRITPEGRARLAAERRRLTELASALRPRKGQA